MDNQKRPVFTKEMKKDYTVLAPQMLKIHFEFFEAILRTEGYNFEVLKTTNPEIVEEGLRSVHNDTCYPALLVIGQMIEALKSGKYDTKKVALMLTQTGGGCRASNYIHLLRKALIKAGFEYVPVISLSLQKLENNPGFSLDFKMIKKLNASVLVSDLLMWVSNYKKAYEIEEGNTERVLKAEIEKAVKQIASAKPIKKKALKKLFEEIVTAFDKIPQVEENKPKVGIVGEIYVKFAPLGNNNLEEFLHNEGAQIVVPGLYDFVIYQLDATVTDINLYGGKLFKKWYSMYLRRVMINWQSRMIEAINKSETLPRLSGYKAMREMAEEYIGLGNKMGEGWLLIGEIIELLHIGVNNIVCAQPFGCLPNHIIGKGMIKKIKDKNPDSNIMPIDYDPGASRVNQENRIKLMLSNANKKIEKDKK